MLAGRRPFESEDKVKIISMHLAHAPPRIRDVNPAVDVPLALEQVVLQAMEKSRENRFATAAAFLQALDDAEAQAREAELARRGDATLPAIAICRLPARPRARACRSRSRSLVVARRGRSAVKRRARAPPDARR